MPSTAELLANLPPDRTVSAEELAGKLAGGHKFVVLDDHPTGSQSMVDVPVLTAWSPDQIEWGLSQDSPVLYIVTSTRALPPAVAEDRILEALTAVLEVAQVPVSFILRSDSSLRGHFPLDVDVVVNALQATTAAVVDGIVIVPAFPEAKRVTVDGVHYVSEWADHWTPIGQTRFGREPRFPFSSSDLREWISEKSRGRYDAGNVLHVPLEVVRNSSDAVASVLLNTQRARPVVADAVTDNDLRSIALGALTAMEHGRTFVFRASPPFVRAIAGQPEASPLSLEEVAAVRTESALAANHGLVVVGTPVPFTRRQVRVMTNRRPIRDVAVSVPALLDTRRDAHIDDVVMRAVAGLATTNVMVRLSDMHVELEARGDFAIDARIAKAVNEIVYQISKRVNLGFVVARGGSIVAPVAQSLGVRRAIVQGPMLPGIVSLWKPLSGRIAGVPFVVYAGGVGSEDGLADVVDVLSGIQPPIFGREEDVRGPSAPPREIRRLAVVGLGSKGLPVAARLAEEFSVVTWDIDPQARARAEASRLEVARSAAGAVDDATTILIAVRNHDALKEVLYGDTGIADVLPAGSVVVVLMAVEIAEIRAIARDLAERGVHLVDAPLSGGGERARRGEIACLVGAEERVFNLIRDVLEHTAATVIHAGESVGDGQAMKAVNQLLAAVNLVGVAEALTLANALGLDEQLTLRALSSGAAYSFMAADRGPRMVQASSGTTPQPMNRLDITAAELQVALAAARDYTVAAPVAAAAEQVFLRALRSNDPNSDDSAIISTVERG